MAHQGGERKNKNCFPVHGHHTGDIVPSVSILIVIHLCIQNVHIFFQSPMILILALVTSILEKYSTYGKFYLHNCIGAKFTLNAIVLSFFQSSVTFYQTFQLCNIIITILTLYELSFHKYLHVVSGPTSDISSFYTGLNARATHAILSFHFEH